MISCRLQQEDAQQACFVLIKWEERLRNVVPRAGFVLLLLLPLLLLLRYYDDRTTTQARHPGGDTATTTINRTTAINTSTIFSIFPFSIHFVIVGYHFTFLWA